MQTILHSIVGRVRCPWPIGERVFLTLQDNTTLTFDVYQPLNNIHEGKIVYIAKTLYSMTTKNSELMTNW